MSKYFNFTTGLSKLSIGICLLGSCLAIFGSKTAIASSSDTFGLELHYRDSAFQCGANTTQADIKIEVRDRNNTLLTTMSKGEKYLTTDIDSVGDLSFVYKVYNLSCITSGSSRAVQDWMLLGNDDTVPDIDGFSDQASIQQMLVGLDSYEELFLVELGTDDTTSSAYDLQDVILVVDNNPTRLFAD